MQSATNIPLTTFAAHVARHTPRPTCGPLKVNVILYIIYIIVLNYLFRYNYENEF